MSAFIKKAVCYFFFLTFQVLCAVDNPTLSNVLDALEKMVNYYQENHRQVNLDGIYGLRVVEGQLQQILSRHSSGRYPHLSPFLVGRLQNLHTQAHNISESSLPYLKSQDSYYFNKLKPLIDQPTTVFHSYRRLDHGFKWKDNYASAHAKMAKFDEAFSDRCMGELMGTQGVKEEDPESELGQAEAPGGTKCQPTVPCLQVMFSRGRGEYELTHQLLYTLLAEKMQCLPLVDKWLHEQGEAGGVEHMRLELCSNNFAEMQDQIHLMQGHIYPIYQDLFMEQQFVCPALGFMEFLHYDWLKQMLAWQRSNGCFGRMHRELSQELLRSKHTDYSYEDLKNESVFKRRGAGGGHNQPLERHELPSQENGIGQPLNSTLEFRHVVPPDKDPAGGNFHPAGGNFHPAGGNFHPAGEPPMKNMHFQAGIAEARMGQYGSLEMKQADINSFNKNEFVRNSFRQNDGDLRNNVAAVNDGAHVNRLGLRGDNLRKLLTRDNDLDWKSRRLLVEKSLGGGCLSHKTAVAAGALSQYLRFMIDPGSDIYGNDIRLDGINLLTQPLGHGDNNGDKAAHLQGINNQNSPGHVLHPQEDSHNPDGKDYKNDDNYKDNKEDLGENQEETDDYINDDNNDFKEEKNPEDYLDKNAYDDEADDEENVNPKMQPNMNKMKDTKQEEEYAHYIDEDDQEKHPANLDPNQEPRKQARRDSLLDTQNKQQEEESYSYYDNQEEQGAPNKLPQKSAHKLPAVEGLNEHGMPNPIISPFKLYMFIVCITIILLYFMFKFVRRRRVLIKYYHH